MVYICKDDYTYSIKPFKIFIMYVDQHLGEMPVSVVVVVVVVVVEAE